MNRRELNELRQQINECDRHLLEIISERVALVREIADLKRRSELPMHDPQREQTILESFESISCPIERSLMESIYRQIFSSGMALWRKTDHQSR